MRTNPAPKFTLATNAQLKKPSYVARLKLATANCGISDRDFPTAIQDMLLEIDMQNGEIWTEPERVDIPLIDDEWSDLRLVRRFLESDDPISASKLRWLDLFWRAKFPLIARHFDR